MVDVDDAAGCESGYSSLRGLADFLERQGIRDGKPFHQHTWLMLSQVIPAAQAASLIRDHRGRLENKVHWLKDAVQGEDASLIRGEGARRGLRPAAREG